MTVIDDSILSIHTNSSLFPSSVAALSKPFAGLKEAQSTPSVAGQRLAARQLLRRALTLDAPWE